MEAQITSRATEAIAPRLVYEVIAEMDFGAMNFTGFRTYQELARNCVTETNASSSGPPRLRSEIILDAVSVFGHLRRYNRQPDMKRTSFKRHVGIVGLTLLLCRSLYPCSIVVIGGHLPRAVRQVSGRVVGSGRIELMGNGHDEERRSTKVADATISIRRRTDTEFFKKGEIQYPPGVKPSGGNLKKWECGIEVSEVQTDQAGSLTISQLKPGKYCLEITGPQTKDAKQTPMHESFIIDVVASAPKTTLIADISPRWPDCSGGRSLQLKPLD